MFGLKIIKESEYNKLTRIKKEAEERIKNVIDGRKRVEADCESLREQLNKYIMKEKKHGEFASELSSISELVVLKTEEYPCDKCKLESDKCIKLHFADRTICVTHKNNVNVLKSKKK